MKMLRLFKSPNFKYKYLLRRYSTKINPDVVESIKSIFGPKNFSLSESVRYHYSKDESLHKYTYIFKLRGFFSNEFFEYAQLTFKVNHYQTLLSIPRM